MSRKLINTSPNDSYLDIAADTVFVVLFIMIALGLIGLGLYGFVSLVFALIDWAL